MDDGAVVAQLSLAAPDSSRFILRGTIPLPAKLHPLDATDSPFMIRAPHGELSEAQVEIVSRYPDAEDGADVVEVLAIVESPEGTVPGERLTYDVIHSVNEPTPHAVLRSVARLLGTPGLVTLRATDVFEHTYEADLLRDIHSGNAPDLRLFRDGSVARQVRTHENLEPLEPAHGNHGTLPHLMGVHSYVTTWSYEEFVSLDLRVHNGHDGLLKNDEGDDPMGKLYFNELELVVPAGWNVYQAYPTPSMGSSYPEGSTNVFPLVAPLSGNSFDNDDDNPLHVMLPQAQFHRRLVIVREGFEARALSCLREQGLAFCVDGYREDGQRYYSWWNQRTARFWGQNLPMPNLAYLEKAEESRTELQEEFYGIYGALTEGTTGPWPIIHGNLGWAHPWGPKSGFLAGGTEIYFSDGIETVWGSSQAGYRIFQMSHRMYTERHPTALYNLNGDSYSLEDWIVDGLNGPYLPTWIFLIPWLPLGDPFGFTSAPTFQVDYVEHEHLQPDYEPDLAEFQYIDPQHLIRYTRSPKVLAWLGNDAIAKDDLKLQAELCRATYSSLPQNELGQGIDTGLLTDHIYVESNPHDGFNLDRGEGWILDTVASAYALGSQDWRNTIRPWFDEVIDLISRGQNKCTGTIMSKPNNAHFNGQYRLIQSISECILQNGLWAVRASVFKESEIAAVLDIEDIIRKSTYAMIGPLIWDEVSNSPHFYTALGPYNQSLLSFCDYVPYNGHEGNDTYQTWNCLVFGSMLSQDPRFLQRAAEMAGGNLTPWGIGSDSSPGDLETRAGMISLLQMGGDLESGYSTDGSIQDAGAGSGASSSKD